MPSSRDAQKHPEQGLEQFYVKIGNCDLGSTTDAFALPHPDAKRDGGQNWLWQFICKWITKDGFILAELFQWKTLGVVDRRCRWQWCRFSRCLQGLIVTCLFQHRAELKTYSSEMLLPASPDPGSILKIPSPRLSESAVSHLPIHPGIQFCFLMYFKSKSQSY